MRTNTKTAFSKWKRIEMDARPSISKALQQVKEGKVIGHEVIMKKYERMLSK